MDETPQTPEPEKKGWAERMVEIGDSGQKAAKATSKAGCGITTTVLSLVFVVVLGLIFYAVAC